MSKKCKVRRNSKVKSKAIIIIASILCLLTINGQQFQSKVMDKAMNESEVVLGDVGTDENFQVMTCEDFFGMANGKEYVTKNFILNNNLDCQGKTYDAIANVVDDIYIDGQGYNISNFVVRGQGIFKVLNKGVILKNFSFENFQVSSSEPSTGGVVANMVGAEVSGITVKNIVISGKENVGGLIGNAREGSVVKDITAYNVNVTGEYRVGGIIGWLQGNAENILVDSGTILGDNSTGGAVGYVKETGSFLNGITKNLTINVLNISENRKCGASSLMKTNYYGCNGGVVGSIDGGVVENVHTYNTKISGQYSTGGVVGWMGGNLTNATSDEQTIVDGKEMVGGVTGGIENGKALNVASAATVKGVVNVGGISPYIKSNGILEGAARYGGTTTASGYDGKLFLGGVVGALEGGLINSYNLGTVIALGEGTSVGGVVGRIRQDVNNLDVRGYLNYGYNLGDVRADDANKVGGVIGDLINNTSVKEVYARGNISGKSEVGGIIGQHGLYEIKDESNVNSALFLGGIVTAKNQNAGRITGRKFSESLYFDTFSYNETEVINPGNYNNLGNIASLNEISDLGWQTNRLKIGVRWKLEVNYLPLLKMSGKDFQRRESIGETKIITEGDTRFYLDEIGNIKYAEVWKNNSVKTYYEYYANTKYGEHGKNIKYVFTINDFGYIVKAEAKKANSRETTAYYEYYEETIYGNHGTKIKYIFNVDAKGNVVKAEAKKNNSKETTAYYEYYENTRYGNHGFGIRFIIYVDKDNNVIGAEEKRNNTKKTTMFYEYYPNAKYKAHGLRIKYLFYLKEDDAINYAIERKDGEKTELRKFFYEENTKYGQHKGKIIKIILL